MSTGNIEAAAHYHSPPYQNRALPAAHLYLVIVAVKYSKEESAPTYRFWTCRVVALDEDTAKSAAMVWAERQKPSSVYDGTTAFAYEASIGDQIGNVDCIAESVITGKD